MKEVNFCTNKQRFIYMLGNYPEKKCYIVYHDSGDANVLIVKKAVELTTLMDIAPVGENTDLFILLCRYAWMDTYDIFFWPEPKKTVKKPKV